MHYLPDPGIEPRSFTLQADSLPSEQPGMPKKNVIGSRHTYTAANGIYRGGFYGKWGIRNARMVRKWTMRGQLTQKHIKRERPLG